MTREEAIELKAAVGRLMYSDNKDARDYNALIEFIDASLRPVSREQVGKAFSGCSACNDRRCTSCRCFGWYEEVCRQCENQSGYQPLKFCPHCGKPLRDEAVEMMMRRLEEMRND